MLNPNHVLNVQDDLIVNDVLNILFQALNVQVGTFDNQWQGFNRLYVTKPVEVESFDLVGKLL